VADTAKKWFRCCQSSCDMPAMCRYASCTRSVTWKVWPGRSFSRQRRASRRSSRYTRNQCFQCLLVSPGPRLEQQSGFRDGGTGHVLLVSIRSTRNKFFGACGFCVPGYFTFELSHYALSYDATSGTLNGKTNIRELVTLDPSGNLFAGTFTITVFNRLPVRRWITLWGLWLGSGSRWIRRRRRLRWEERREREVPIRANPPSLEFARTPPKSVLRRTAA
jgi:hypothetical protein